MKYNITINQKAIIDNGWNLKANHIAVLEVIREYILCGRSKSLIDGNYQWFWVSYDVIIEQLPMFDIAKDRCRQLVYDLQKYELIDIYEGNQRLAKTYFKIGKNYEKFIFSNNETSEINSIGTPNTSEKNSIGNHQTSEKNSSRPLEKIQDNNNHYYNIDIYKEGNLNKLDKILISKSNKPDDEFKNLVLPEQTRTLALMKFLKSTNFKNATNRDMEDFWKIFKEEFFNSINYYERVVKIFGHFTNWIVYQKLGVEDTYQKNNSELNKKIKIKI